MSSSYVVKYTTNGDSQRPLRWKTHNTVDLEPRNCCNYIRCKYIAQSLLIKRRFGLSYMYVPLVVPEPFVESMFFKENIYQKSHMLLSASLNLEKRWAQLPQIVSSLTDFGRRSLIPL